MLCLLTSAPSLSQTGFFCGYNPADPQDPVTDKLCQFFGAVSDQEAIKTVEAILGKIGVRNRSGIRIVPCLKLKNCYAYFLNDALNRAQYILYDPQFLDKVKSGPGSDWGAKCVLAHEVAHILLGHTLKLTGTTPALELEADEWSGWALYRLGVPQQQLLDGIAYYAEDVLSETHPPIVERSAAIQEGYQRARKEYLDGRPDDVPVSSLDAARKKYEAAMAIGDTKRRITLLTEAIELYPDYEDAFYYRSGAFSENGEDDKALQDINEAIRLDKEDAYNHFFKSKLLSAAKGYQAAEASISAAVSLDPENTTILVQQADVKYLLNKYAAAVNICTKIIRIEPDNMNAYQIRGNSRCYLQEYQTAVDDLSKALDISPGNGNSLWGRGNAYLGLENYRAALADFEKAKALGTEPEEMDRLISIAKEKLAANTKALSGEFTKVWVEHGVLSGNERGMNIFMNIDLYNMKGIPARVVAYFHYEDGRALPGVENYTTSDGELSAGDDLADNPHDAATYNGHKMFVPYSVFAKLPAGDTNLKFDVYLWEHTTDKPTVVCQSEYTRFIYSRK
jgi:tetratricopeptide (TPR) repeat protein